MNAVLNFRRIFLGLSITLYSMNCYTQVGYPFNIEPVIINFELPQKLKNQQLYDLQFDYEGRLFLVSQSLISVFNGENWSYIYFKSTPFLTFDHLGKAWVIHENEIGTIETDSAFTHFFFPSRLEGLDKTPPLSGISQFISGENKIYLNFGKSIFFIENNRLNKINQDFHDAEITSLQNHLIIADNAKYYTPNGVLIKEIEALEQAGNLKFFHHPKGLLSYNVLTSEFSSFDKNFENKQAWGLPTEGIRSGVYLEELNAYCFFLDSGKVIIINNKGNILSSSDFNAGLNDSPLIKSIRSTYGHIWVLKDRSISRLSNPSDYLRISIPNSIGVLRDFTVHNSGVFIGSGQGLFELSGNNLTKISNQGILKLLNSPDGLYYLTRNSVSLYNSGLPPQSYSLNGLDMSFDQLSKSLMVRTEDDYYIFQTDRNELKNPVVIAAPVKSGVSCFYNKTVYQVTGKSLFLIQPGNQKSEEIPLPSGLNGLEIIKILPHKGSILLLCPEQAYTLNGRSIYPLEWLEKDPLYQELSDIITAGNSLAILRKDPAGGSELIIKTDSQQFNKKLNSPLPGNRINPLVGILTDSFCLYSVDNQIFITRLKDPEFQKTYTALISSIYTEKQDLTGCIERQGKKEPGENRIKRIPFTNSNLSIKAFPTDYTNSDYRHQYSIVGRDSGWSDWKKGNDINISGLKQGEYLLKIRFLNNEGVISQSAKLTFSVQPPFYRTWWAYSLYLLFLFIAGFILYKSYLFRKHRPVYIENPNYSDQPGGVPPIQEEYQQYLEGSPMPEQRTERQSKWDKYEMTTVLFSDIQGFTKIAEMMNPELLIDELDKFFFHFDSVVEKYNIEKIKTIGDAYMAAGGIPRKNSTNPIEVVLAALEMQQYMKHLKKSKTDIWDLRIGIHSGPVIAGIIGHKKRSYDIWGDTVNTASRMESSGEAGKVNISGLTYMLVKDYFLCEYRGKLPVKYKGNIDMYFVKGLRPELSINLGALPNRRFFLKLQLLRLQDLEQNIFPMLEKEIPESAFFHNSDYAKHLNSHAAILALAENLDLEESLLVRTAAILMLTGIVHTFRNFENKSAEIAGEILPEYQYSPKQVQEVKTLILSTKWPMEPRNHLERIMCDLKMEYLGRIDYPELIQLLCKEQGETMKPFNPAEWKNEQIRILNTFSYFTSGARRLREIPSEEQVRRLEELNW